MRGAWRVDLLRPFNQLGGLSCRILHRNNLIILPVKNQRWEVKLLQVFGEVCFGERFDAFVRTDGAGLHAPDPELIQNTL